MKPNVLLLSLVLLLATACGVKVKTAPGFDAAVTNKLAVLPVAVDNSSSIAPDKLTFIQRALASELRNAGFQVLDSDVVSTTCISPSCSERDQLVRQYGVTSFAELTVHSAARNNFLAGYVNLIHGTLRLRDLNGRELISIDRTESERGGLLFNSGQLLQGVISQVANSGDISFTRLASKFAKTVVAQLPRASSTDSVLASAAMLNVDQVQLDPFGPHLYKVCATGSRGAFASLVFNRRRSSLRETTPGQYCGIYRIENNSMDSSALVVELESPYGQAARRELSSSPISSFGCFSADSVQLIRKGGKPQLSLTCVRLSSHSVATGDSCGKECTASKVLIYRASEARGPYRKVTELQSSTRWTDHSANADQDYLYQVVVVDKQGGFSAPLPLESKHSS